MAKKATPTFEDGLGDLALADGPWSVTKAPANAEFLDFGPLQLPAIAGLKARVEIDPKFREVGAVSVLVNDCAVQLQVVAARSGKPLWPQLRRVLLVKLKRQPGHQQVIEGHFGAEVIAAFTTRNKEGVIADVPMRFVGIDGDKWMLRAVVTGPSVLSDATVARVNALLSNIAVERGTDARAEGEVLALKAPPGELDYDSFPDTAVDTSHLTEPTE